MGAIELYAIFAFSVGIWACIDFLPEVRRTLFEANQLDDVMYDSPFIAFFTLMIMSAITAPLVVPSILIPSWRARCIASLTKRV